jgi:hypothetical protein
VALLPITPIPLPDMDTEEGGGGGGGSTGTGSGVRGGNEGRPMEDSNHFNLFLCQNSPLMSG